MKMALRVFVLLVVFVGFSASAWAAEGTSLSQNVYKQGMTHGDVQIIQAALKKDGVFKNDKTTTYFGSVTKKAVEDFQKKYGLEADGIVGKGTISKMVALGLIDGTNNSQVVSRGSRRSSGAYLDWWSEVSKMISRNDILTIEDLDTGKTFKVQVTAGTNHADVETLSKEDTAVIKSIWGGFSWDRRPVLVYTGDQTIAASMTAMPHAGVDSAAGGTNVSGRSGGYGSGYNFDFIKDNGMDGHIDLHFKNSLRHKDDKVDPQHQQAIQRAAGLK
ncbi:peptidoglycan hydrolase-like protein with peptidoglycan-binding domain [Anaerosolibacter carboniphilus]|uniref:Peptidoglycan hydrolase-like protein with peptidoglycan-binding domain n=1 Tax=Anaerosolibacter carboniphilus TaxID=1417629 RepID=A0A841KUQ6_9FIRM|nr:peptidoglycan-binding domain-containing protein [Anaerosolibacter carboniphilus]MBB6217127.1 peptidoglycan hydrolase-like protein with peptidoglycan-binding domain [Anaerosolibacter carboniphilus]